MYAEEREGGVPVARPLFPGAYVVLYMPKSKSDDGPCFFYMNRHGTAFFIRKHAFPSTRVCTAKEYHGALFLSYPFQVLMIFACHPIPVFLSRRFDDSAGHTVREIAIHALHGEGGGGK